MIIEFPVLLDIYSKRRNATLQVDTLTELHECFTLRPKTRPIFRDRKNDIKNEPAKASTLAVVNGLFTLHI